MLQETIQTWLQQMTDEEKATLCGGMGHWRTQSIDRLGIPAVMMTDGPHGLRKMLGGPGNWQTIHSTCMPTASALASSWNREILALAAKTISDEAKSEGVGMILGPGINMKRSPLCGRNFEYFSEDPYLSGTLAAEYIEAAQKNGVGTCLKHFAVNNQESRRFTTSAEINERTLRETYLSAFELAIQKSKPEAIMASYNRINGTPATECKWLLDDILRGEWGYEGLVVSDWEAVNDRVQALLAGCDLEMPDSHGDGRDRILRALKNGTLSHETLDRAVGNVLAFVYRHMHDEVIPCDMEKDHENALHCAHEAMVLLKNEGALPLSGKQSLAVIGDAEMLRIQGSGSSKVLSDHIDCNALAQICARNAAPVTYHSFASADAEILEAAAAADCAVVFVGLPESFEFEGADRKHMRLPDRHLALAEAVCAVQKNTVIVLTCGSAVELPFAPKANAILLTYLAGEAAAPALGDILYGEVNPSGKLTETFPMQYSDTPAFLNFPGDDDICVYGEGIYIGYRYYDKRGIEVRYPFGHGLSYTTFAYSDFAVDAEKVSLTVTNTGKVYGGEVVQVYVGENTPSVSRPPRELCGYEKVFLSPGESRRITIEIPRRSYAYWNVYKKGFQVNSGMYTVYVGASSRDIRHTAEVRVSGDKPVYRTIDGNTLMADVMYRAAYAPIRDIFASAMLSNTKYEENKKEFGATYQNPSVRGRLVNALRQAVHYNPGFNQEILEKTIEKCNAVLEGKED